MINIKRKTNNATEIILSLESYNEGDILKKQLMSDDYVLLNFSLSSPIVFCLGDYVDIYLEDPDEVYGRYEIIEEYKPKFNTQTGCYDYQLKFEAYYMKWKNKKCKYQPTHTAKELSFSLTSTIAKHCQIIISNLSALGYTYNGEEFICSVDGTVDTNAGKLVKYDNVYIHDALNNIATAFECEWWVESHVIHFGKCQDTSLSTPAIFEIGANISEMSKSSGMKTPATRMYAFGSDRNLPSDYKSDPNPDLTQSAVVQRRLMLPTISELDQECIDLLNNSLYELSNSGYIQVKGINESEAIEDVYVNDSIYPKTECWVKSYTTYEDTVENEDGTTTTRTYYRIVDGSGFGEMFETDWILEGNALHIVFLSGSLNGMDFECHFEPASTGSNVHEAYFEIVANEDYGRFLPDSYLHPSPQSGGTAETGDKFALYNWDSSRITETPLIVKASRDLLKNVVDHMDNERIDPDAYNCTEECFEENYRIRELGEKVTLVNAGYFSAPRESRITGMEIKLDLPYDHPKYVVSNKADKVYASRQNNTEALTFNGESIKAYGTGSGVYIIKENDNTRPTNNNVFSALRSREDFISAKEDDSTNGLIGFVKGLWVKARGLFGIDENGDANLNNINANNIVAKGLTAQEAHFFNLIIDEVKSAGGQIVISPANAEIVHVIKNDNWRPRPGAAAIPAYILYFKAEDGTGKAITNQFATNDLVLHMEFNVAQAQTKNYWYPVIAGTYSEGREPEEIDLDGDGEDETQCHYIVVRQTGKDGSGVPQAGDDVVCLGNTNNTSRQNAIVLSAYNIPFIDSDGFNGDEGIYAPLFVEYTDVNGYNVGDGNRRNVIARNGTRLRGDFQVWNGSSRSYSSITALIQALSDSITLRVDEISNRDNANLIPQSTFPKKYDEADLWWNSVGTRARTAAGEQVAAYNMQDDATCEPSTDNQMGACLYAKEIFPSEYIYYDIIAQKTLVTSAGVENLVLEHGAWYTLSWWQKRVSGASVECVAYYLHDKAEQIYIDGVASENWKTTDYFDPSYSDTDEWVRHTITFKTRGAWESGETVSIEWRLRVLDTTSAQTPTEYWITRVQLEKGMVATEWKPAPEEVVESSRYQTLFEQSSKLINIAARDFNDDGSVKNTSGIMVKAIGSGIYAQKPNGDLALIGVAVEEGGQTVIKLTADNIKLEGLVTANQNFKILNDGSIEAKNGKFSGEINIYDHDNGLTVYDEEDYVRVNIQSDPIGDIAHMANDTYTYISPAINIQTSSFNNAITSSIGSVSAERTIDIDNIRISTHGNGSNTDYPTTNRASLTIELLQGSTSVFSETVPIVKLNNYGEYKAEAGIRHVLKESGDLSIRFTISGITNTSSGTYVYLFINARVQTSDLAQTYIGSNGFYSHPGANKLFWIDEKEVQIRFGYGGLRLSLPSEGSAKAQLDTIGHVYGSDPELKPIWMPFHNIMPIFRPSFGINTETIVNTGATGKYVYKINPFNDRGICFIDMPAMDRSGNYQESWILLPRGTQTYNGQNVSLPEGYTVTVINETSLTERKNVYVSIDSYGYHEGKIIDANNNTNYYCALNGTQCRDTYIYVGQRGVSDVWIAMHDTQ